MQITKTAQTRVRALVIITFLLLFFSFAIYTAFPQTQTKAVSPSVVQVNYQQCNAFTCNDSPVHAITTGNSLVVGITFTGDRSFAVTAYSCSDTLGNAFTKLIRSVDQANSLVVAFCIAPIIFGGSDTVTFTVTNPSGATHTLMGAVYEIANGIFHSNYTQEGGMNSFTATCASGDLCISAVAGNVNSGSWTFTGSFDTSSCSCSSAQGVGSQTVTSATWSGITSSAYNEFALIDLTSGSNNCQIYACQTSTYSTTIVTSFCIPNPSTCTNATTSTTWFYDATSSVITYTTCSTTGNGSQYCVTRTQTKSATVTYTDTSVSLVISTATVTTTQTAVLAPTTTSLLYWFFGFCLLIIPPMAMTGIVRRGNPNSDIEFPVMVGLFIGSMLALLVQLLVAGIGFAVLALVIVYFWRRGGS